MTGGAQMCRRHAAIVISAAFLSISVDTKDCQFYDTISSANRDASHDAIDD